MLQCMEPRDLGGADAAGESFQPHPHHWDAGVEVPLVAPGQGEGLWVLGVTSDSTDPAYSSHILAPKMASTA